MSHSLAFSGQAVFALHPDPVQPVKTSEQNEIRRGEYAEGRRPVAFVSQAHSEHLQSHAVTLATPATAALMRHRLGRQGRCRLLPFGRRTEFPGFAVTLYPAGHVLGSAQALVEVDGRRLL